MIYETPKVIVGWIRENKDETSDDLSKMEYEHIEFVKNQYGVFLEI